MEITKETFSNRSAVETNSTPECLELLKLIAVTQPYFALTELRKEDEYLIASIPHEQSDHDEVQSMCIGEVGRHLAILGSLVVADNNPRKQRHYYLATDAYVERRTDAVVTDEVYIGKAKLNYINKRKGEVYAELISQDGEVVYESVVTYAILNENIFDRMFDEHKIPYTGISQHNPYTKRTQMFNLKKGLKSCNASVGVIRKEYCVGHFNEYPAMPIARLGNALCSIAGEHFKHITNTKGKYNIHKAVIHAESFIFAHEKVDIFSQIEESGDDEIVINTFANSKQCCNAVELKCYFK